jgi:hypothetical protein
MSREKWENRNVFYRKERRARRRNRDNMTKTVLICVNPCRKNINRRTPKIEISKMPQPQCYQDVINNYLREKRAVFGGHSGLKKAVIFDVSAGRTRV